MQVPVKVREQIGGSAVINTNPVDVQGMSMIVLSLLVHSIGGTGPQIEAQFQTSENLETWTAVASSITRTTAGNTLLAVPCQTNPYGRYVRVLIQLTGTNPTCNYSAYIGTFQAT